MYDDVFTNRNAGDNNNADGVLHYELQPTTAPEVENSSSLQTVINLSAVPLSTAEQNLLSKGLSFCPTPPHPQTT